MSNNGGNKRKAISLKQKLDIITKLNNGCANAQICREYGLSKFTVSTIWAKRDKYVVADISPNVKKLRQAEREDVDNALLKWFTLKRSQNIPLTGPVLQEKANHFTRLSNTVHQETENNSIKEFTCTTGLVDRFKKRNNIQCGKIHGETAAVSPETTQQWLTTIWSGIRRRYCDKDIFNGDETGIFYKMTPGKTLKFKEEKCYGGKLSKERITAWICANMDGSDKKKLTTISKSKSPRCFKNRPKLPAFYEANKKLWMTSEIFTRLLQNWDYELSKEKRKIVLVIDNCPAHLKINNLRWIELVFLPPNVTATLQHMDQGVIRCLKSHYRRHLLLKIVNAHDKNEYFNISLAEAILMLNTAWRNVSQSTISCFRHAGFNVNIGFTEEDVIPLSEWILRQNNADEPDVSLQQWAKTNSLFDFDNVDLNDYLMIDHNLEIAEFPDDNEIIRSVTNEESDVTEIEIDEEEDREIIIPTAHKVLSSLKVVSCYVQMTHPDNEPILKEVDNLEKLLNYEVLTNRRQTKITDFFSIPMS